jgi:hypothetical protein
MPKDSISATASSSRIRSGRLESATVEAGTQNSRVGSVSGPEAQARRMTRYVTDTSPNVLGPLEPSRRP